MNYATHSLGGAIAGIVVAPILLPGGDVAGEAALMAGAVLGSLFPDIDHTQSWMGHKAPVTSHIVAAVSKHRGFFHSPICCALCFIILTMVSKSFLSGVELELATCFIKGFIPGMVSHMFLDTLNKQGIPWLWPYKKKFHILNITTGSPMEAMVRLCLLTVLGVSVYQKF